MSREEAERYLARLVQQEREARVYGIRPARRFEEAVAKYVLENRYKRSLRNDIDRLKGLMPWIGRERLVRLHMGTLAPYIEHRRQKGRAAGTIHGLKVVRKS